MKLLRIIEFTLVAILLCLSACSEGDYSIEPTPKPEVVKSEITIDPSIITNGLSFTSEKGEQSISFSTKENWTLSMASTTNGATWCTASVTSGSKGTASVKFNVTENTSYDNRSVSVTIKSGTITKTFTISQKSVDAILVTADKYEISQEGGTIDIEVKANISYQMEFSEDAKSWITESSSRGLTTYKHTLNIAMNEESGKREGEVYFKSGDKVETVKIYQAGGSILLLSENEYYVSDKGETISVDIRSNIEYGVQMPDVDWIIDESSSRGMSSHILKYIISANEEYDNRSASIVFYDKNSELKDTLVVNQAQKDAIVVSEKNISVAKEGGIVVVKVASNVDYEVQISSDVTWITQTDSRALVEKNVYMKVAENTGKVNRSAEIIFTDKNSNLSKKVIITQQCPSPTGYNDGVLTIKTAGTMKQLLGDGYLKITSLKIVGPINGDDVLCLRQMLGSGEFSDDEKGKLTSLNLSEATIVEGGNAYYYASYYHDYCYTSNNTIGRYMFNTCANLQNIVLPDGVTSIDYNAFQYCSSLTSIDIPEGVTSIGWHAFQYCTSLTSIDIPDGVTTIGGYCFWDCHSLTSIDIPDGVTLINDYTFFYCRALTSIDIPKSVTLISFEAFAGCSSLASIYIPDSVTLIDYGAFAGCSSLASVHITNLSAWCKIKFRSTDANPLQYAKKLYLNNQELTKLVIPEGITEIKSYAFSGYSSLTSIDIPDSVTSIGHTAFYGCSSLISIDIPDGVTLINDYTFFNCHALTSIDIPDSITSIGFHAFSGCNHLVSVTIGNGVTTIDSYAFFECNALTNIYCYATTPPTLGYHPSFPTYGVETTLHVPKGCGTIYQSSNWANYFKTIKEMN